MSSFDKYGIQYGTGELFPLPGTQGGISDPNDISKRRNPGTPGTDTPMPASPTDVSPLPVGINLINIGTGLPVYNSRRENNFYFKTLIGGENITLIQNAETIEIAYNGSSVLRTNSSSTIQLSGSGILDSPLTANVLLSADPDNAITIVDDGLYVSKLAFTGKSAYEIALDNGFIGTEQDWLYSIKGEAGSTGDKGEKGDKGDPGTDGRDGIDGKDGTNGLDGATGPRGLRGELGATIIPDEYGIFDEATIARIEAADVEWNYLVIAEGDDRADQSLPAALNGDMGGHLVRYEPGGIWRDLGPIVGVSGPEGPEGNVGPRGEKGEKGDRGEQGLQGIQGLKGDQGDRGERGEKGDPGINGSNGINGQDGEKGDPGIGLPKAGTTNQILVKNSNADYDFKWGNPTNIAKFTDLIDAPSTLLGQGNKIVGVNASGTALEFKAATPGADTFLKLTDTPATYSGQSGRAIVVNPAGNGLSFGSYNTNEVQILWIKVNFVNGPMTTYSIESANNSPTIATLSTFQPTIPAGSPKTLLINLTRPVEYIDCTYMYYVENGTSGNTTMSSYWIGNQTKGFAAFDSLTSLRKIAIANMVSKTFFTVGSTTGEIKIMLTYKPI